MLRILLFFLQNKAIVTINARTSEILTANDMAAELFGYSTKTLIGIKMSQLFADVHKEKQEALVEQHIEASGAVVMVNGKVVSEWNITCLIFFANSTIWFVFDYWVYNKSWHIVGIKFCGFCVKSSICKYVSAEKKNPVKYNNAEIFLSQTDEKLLM